MLQQIKQLGIVHSCLTWVPCIQDCSETCLSGRDVPFPPGSGEVSCCLLHGIDENKSLMNTRVKHIVGRNLCGYVFIWGSCCRRGLISLLVLQVVSYDCDTEHNEWSMFHFSDTLFIRASFLILTLAVAGGQMGETIEETIWVECPYIKNVFSNFHLWKLLL